MRITSVSFSFLFLFTTAIFSQDKFKLIGLGVDYGITNYRFSGFDYSDIRNMTDDPSFFAGDDSTDWYERPLSSKYYPATYHKWIDYRLDAIFQLADKSRRMVKLGIQYDSGISYFSELIYNEDFYLDTVAIYYSQSGITDTVYRDSISRKELSYTVNSRNIGVYGEYLFALTKNKRHQIYTGLGIGIGYSITQTVQRSEIIMWQDVYESMYGNKPSFHGIHPYSNPAQGTLSFWNPIEGIHTKHDSKKTMYVSPYVPLTVRTQIYPKGFFSHLYLNVTATAGVKIQMTRFAGVDARLFYGFRGGVAYLF